MKQFIDKANPRKSCNQEVHSYTHVGHSFQVADTWAVASHCSAAVDHVYGYPAPSIGLTHE